MSSTLASACLQATLLQLMASAAWHCRTSEHRYRGKLLVHHYVPGDDLTSVLLQLIHCCCSNCAAAQQLAVDAARELLAAVTCADALDGCLAALRGGHMRSGAHCHPLPT
jgi:hypothetical protein